MQTRVLIVDRNPGLPEVLRSILPELDLCSIQGGAATEMALEGFRPMVALVDLETRDVENALAILRAEGVPVVLVSEEEDADSPKVANLFSRFGIVRFIQRPFPLLDLGDVLQEAHGGKRPGASVVQRSTREQHPIPDDAREAELPKAAAAKDRPAKKRKKRRKRSQASGPNLMKLLTREWQLTEQAEPWTVLGLPSTESPEAVLVAGRRMLNRYEPIAQDENAKEPLRQLARQIADRVRWAMDNAKAPEPESPASKVPREEMIFNAGLESMGGNDWESALRFFRKAHKLAANEPRYMGYYGWALWKVAERQGGEEQERNRSEGEELLRLCDSLDPTIGPCQLFLVRVELQMGLSDRARGRVERLRRRGEGNLDQVEVELRRIERSKKT